MKTLTINFGGFYDSHHSDVVDGSIDSLYADDQGEVPEDFDYSKVNYKAFKDAYCKRYLKLVLTEWMAEEYGLKIMFGFECLDSPRFYNFETDVIQARTTNRHHAALLAVFRADAEFLEYLKAETKNREGFHSFYDYSQAFKNTGDILHVYIFKFVCEQIERVFHMLHHEPFNELENDVTQVEL